MAVNADYAELEIRILERQGDHYPVELTLNDEREFPRGCLAAAPLPVLDVESGVEAGEALFAWLFKDESLQRSWAEVREAAPQCRLRLRIDASAPELHALPWEMLREAREGFVPVELAASPATPFSRYLAGAWPPGSPIRKYPVRILVAISVPDNLVEYGLEAFDWQEAWQSMKKTMARLDVSLVLLPQPCTLAALASELQNGYHILHFIGHGQYNSKRRQAALYMADAANQVEIVSDARFAEMLAHQAPGHAGGQDQALRLVFLESCQTATRDTVDAFRGFAPHLVQAGAPAVLAMQEKIAVKTAQQFRQVFYAQLLTHGLVDLACNEARRDLQAARLSGAAIPVLFMRLPNGRLWYRPGFTDDDESMWEALLLNIRNHSCTPILGPDFNPLLGSRREIAQRWAKTHRFPMSTQEASSLPHVAQFLAVQQGTKFPLNMLIEHLRQQALRQFAGRLPPDAALASFNQLTVMAGKIDQEESELAGNRVLAALPFRHYITSSPSSLLAETLRLAGKTPKEELCHWNRFRDKLPSDSGETPDYEPDVQHPLVYYLFGNFQRPESVVLTEDDYFDYLIGVSNDRELIPGTVRSALADTALLFLGFRMEDWDFRVLFRTIINRESSFLLSRYKHIAVQINPDESQIQDVERARRYLQSYFGKAHVHIYWGSVSDFISELWRRWQKGTA